MPASSDARDADTARRAPAEWSALLVDAVNKPGVISTAYSRFWQYSVGNQLLALFQCMSRNLAVGPINTFQGWLKLGRYVRKGEKAITLCMPVEVKRRRDSKDSITLSEEKAAWQEIRLTRFLYKPHWFVLCQTEGQEYEPVNVPAWSEDGALKAPRIHRVPFTHTDGNCQGYARAREVAVSPIAFMPHRTLFHELAHVVLGHTAEISEGTVDGAERVPRDLREVEAECGALICSESLGLPGAEFSRGYIQHWIKGQAIPERSAQKIFKSADEIIRAGRVSAEPWRVE